LSYSIIFETACDLGGTGLLLLVNCFQFFKNKTAMYIEIGLSERQQETGSFFCSADADLATMAAEDNGCIN